MPVCNRRLELRYCAKLIGTRSDLPCSKQADRRNPHICAAAFRMFHSRVLPCLTSLERFTRPEAGHSGRPVIVGRVKPLDKSVTQGVLYSIWCQRAGRLADTDRLADSHGHLGIVRYTNRVAFQIDEFTLRPPVNNLLVRQKLDWRAKGIAHREAKKAT